MFFVQDEESKLLLEKFGVKKVEISGDTRFDRVTDTVNRDEEIPGMSEFKSANKLLVFGSAWGKETEFAIEISKRMPNGWKMLFAPHEIKATKIDEFIKSAAGSKVLFSELEKNNGGDKDILVLNTVGHLARLYKYADVAVVGGGFTDGIHNILEPLVFGVPVFFGPNHLKFSEGQLAINNGVGEELSDFNTFQNSFLNLASNSKLLDTKREKAKLFVQNRRGATEKIAKFLNKIGQIISCQIY